MATTRQQVVKHPPQRVQPRNSAVAEATAAFGKSLLVVIAGQTIVVAVCIAIIFILAAKQVPPPQSYAVDPQGRVTKLIPLSVMPISPIAIKDFASRALAETFTFGYQDWRFRFSNAKHFYTADGLTSVQSYLEKSGLLAQVTDRELLSVASVQQAVMDTQQSGVDANNIAYVTVYLRVQLDLSDRQKTASQSREYKVVIRRMDSLENSELMAIERITESLENKIPATTR